MKTPPKAELTRLLVALKRDIDDDCRASEDPFDDKPGMQVTIGANADGKWNYQTGDNSYTGNCYGLPYWGIVYLYRDSNCSDLAADAIDQIEEAQAMNEEEKE